MLASLVIQTLNGLASASLLFLVALGLTLIFGVTRIVNFAHGSLYMLGAYIGVTLFDWLGGGAAGFWGGALGAAVSGGGLGPLLGGTGLRRPAPPAGGGGRGGRSRGAPAHPHRRQRRVGDVQRALHRHRLQLAHAGAERIVEKRHEQQQQRDDTGHGPHQEALGHGALATICEEQHVDEDHAGDDGGVPRGARGEDHLHRLAQDVAAQVGESGEQRDAIGRVGTEAAARLEKELPRVLEGLAEKVRRAA